MISIIIPNDGRNISDLIESINLSTYKDFEIIVVDEGLERSAQRNIGIQKSKGEFILFVDSDWQLDPRLLEECVYLMRFADALYIPETIMTKGLFARIRNWERQFYNQTAIDVVRFVKRERCVLFDETMTGPEDHDWDRRVNGLRLITYYPYYHYDNVSILDYFRKKAYYSGSMERFNQKYPHDLITTWRYRCFGVFTENGKWRKFFGNPIMALCVLGIIFIKGVIYHANR